MLGKPSKFLESMREIVTRLAPRTHTPLHSGTNLFLPRSFNELYRYDLSEIEELDDLHNPHGVLAEAQLFTAEFFSSRASFFSVGGASTALMAACLVLGEGGKVLIPCNAHKSLIAGLILIGAEPIWYEPEWDSQIGIYRSVDPGLVSFLVKQNPDLKAFFITSPTYEGIQSDLEKIVPIAHQAGIPVIVDESHGAHLSLLGLPHCGLESGGDLVIHSIHKSLGGLTQTGILHFNSNLISKSKVAASLSLLQTTSPSFLLLLSIVESIYQIGQNLDLLRKPYQQALKLRNLLDKMEDRGVKVLHNHDPLHCLISIHGYAGSELSEWLYQNGKLETELEGANWVMLLLGLGLKRSDLCFIQRLIRQAALERRMTFTDPPLPIPKPKPLITYDTPRRAFFKSESPSFKFKCPPGIPTNIPGSAPRGFEI
ncbi:MAG: aminotransferase class I/II-fold pyridoxal phosphate-dependent enzyme [Candidatus Caenarcaniphilales bacterium]|nr:aminotransferase class I/II-fold pyridoxal phosphate-dependent enzyme [Candidatus Caenarcaniphilales bacterium]